MPSLWTVVAPCANMRSMTTAVVTEADVETPQDEDIIDELIVEEISIDGMCGVY